MDSLTQPKWLSPRAQGNQPQEASIGGLIGPPIVKIWILPGGTRQGGQPNQD